MLKTRVLYIAQEMDPYTSLSEMGTFMRKFVLNANKKAFEMRILMPKFGTINERRHKLHEVVRLSGMNIIIDDDDFPLIIKVASLPESRIQVYFLDNDEFFKRKNVFRDEDGEPFDDNENRMIFFCKGGMETVKKFGWPPDIIHASGWMGSLIPLFLRKVYSDDPVYQHSKVIYTPFIEDGSNKLSESFKEKVLINDMVEGDLNNYLDKDGEINLDLGAMLNSDGVILPSDEGMEKNIEILEKNNIPYYIHKPEDETYLGDIEFYNNILKD